MNVGFVDCRSKVVDAFCSTTYKSDLGAEQHQRRSMTLSKKFRASGLLSTGDVARELSVHRSTVWLWIKSGLLKSSKVGDLIGVKRSDLERFQTVYHVNGAKENS